MKKQIVLQTSLFSHTDGVMYSVDEAVRLALDCQAAGASVLHVHAHKLGGPVPFLEMARALEHAGGPLLNIAVSDYKLLTEGEEELPKNIAVAAMHGGNCRVFGTDIHCAYESCERDMEEYLRRGFLPEVCIFNLEGAKNCSRLLQTFGKRFFVGAYLGYPEELSATRESIEAVLCLTRGCLFTSFVLYNNQNDDLFREILALGGHLRSGMEDSIYCGTQRATDSRDHTRHLAAVIREAGMEPTPTLDLVQA